MAVRTNTDLETLRERNYSQDYVELIVQYPTTAEVFLDTYSEFTPEILTANYSILHTPVPPNREIVSLVGLNYSYIPKLYTLLDTTSIEAAGILRTQNQPILNLSGTGVLVGFIDTGVEYTHPAFKTSDGRTRIIRIWDQTIMEGPPPANHSYGTEYTQDMINKALQSENPLSIVPSTDTLGHGTFVAGVATGSRDPANDFTGAAPGCEIVAVKLKPAKEYLRNFFFVSQDAVAYQESDIISAILYLTQVASEEKKPMVICIALGTNQGDHAGHGPLAQIIDSIVAQTAFNCIIAGGNEAGKSHHYYGVVTGEGQYDNVEILVGNSGSSFSLELWAQAPELYSIAVRSPIGEIIPQVPARLEQSQIVTFTLEKTKVFIDYEVIEKRSGSQVILIRFQNPTPGIWSIQVYCNNFVNGIFHMWLPITGFVPPDIVFLRPNPDVTLTEPATTRTSIATAAYNVSNNSIFINSSRGYARTGFIKPDLAAPGVNVYGPVLNSKYSSQSGTSASAAITAGAVALIVNWGMTSNNRLYASSEITNFLIRGATRNPNILFPNREWGYGTLNAYNVFETIT